MVAIPLLASYGNRRVASSTGVCISGSIWEDLHVKKLNI